MQWVGEPCRRVPPIPVHYYSCARRPNLTPPGPESSRWGGISEPGPFQTPIWSVKLLLRAMRNGVFFVVKPGDRGSPAFLTDGHWGRDRPNRHRLATGTPGTGQEQAAAQWIDVSGAVAFADRKFIAAHLHPFAQVGRITVDVRFMGQWNQRRIAHLGNRGTTRRCPWPAAELAWGSDRMTEARRIAAGRRLFAECLHAVATESTIAPDQAYPCVDRARADLTQR